MRSYQPTGGIGHSLFLPLLVDHFLVDGRFIDLACFFTVEQNDATPQPGLYPLIISISKQQIFNRLSPPSRLHGRRRRCRAQADINIWPTELKKSRMEGVKRSGAKTSTEGDESPRRCRCQKKIWTISSETMMFLRVPCIFISAATAIVCYSTTVTTNGRKTNVSHA